MTGTARQAGALAALLTFLARGGDGLLAPTALAVAGAVGLTIFGVLALGPRAARALLAPTRPPAPSPPSDAPPS